MDVQISKSLKVIFLIHLIVALVLGVALLLAPARSLTMLGYMPENLVVQSEGVTATIPGARFVDPVITRLFGAALLALGFSSFLGWRASRREQVSLLVQTEFVFCVLGFLGVLLGYRAFQPIPVIAWVMMVILAAFAIAWGLSLRK